MKLFSLWKFLGLRRKMVAHPMSLQGNHVDLQAVYDRLNRLYFSGRLKLTLSWFGNASRSVRSSRTLGSYNQVTRHIKIHRILDHPEIPSYFVDYVVYHEMVHHVCPPKRSLYGKRSVHHPKYQERERQFVGYCVAKAWEKKNLRQLLNARPIEELYGRA